MCDPQLILNARLVNSGIRLDHLGYVVAVCNELYADAVKWISFWNEWNESGDCEYWIMNDSMNDIVRHIITHSGSSRATREDASFEMMNQISKMVPHRHYDLVDNQKMWNKIGVSIVLNMPFSNVNTIFNTLDHVSSMYDNYVDDLEIHGMW